MRARVNTYTSYSIGCASVWGAILLLAQRRLDSQTQDTLRLVCGGWWMGWTSATIARAGFPPPKPLTLAGEKRLRQIYLCLLKMRIYLQGFAQFGFGLLKAMDLPIHKTQRE